MDRRSLAIAMSDGLRDGLEPLIPAYLGAPALVRRVAALRPRTRCESSGAGSCGPLTDGHRLWQAIVAVAGRTTSC